MAPIKIYEAKCVDTAYLSKVNATPSPANKLTERLKWLAFRRTFSFDWFEVSMNFGMRLKSCLNWGVLRMSREHKEEYEKRVAEVTELVRATGSYTHTFDELLFGARTGWRNAPRCIGRIQWNNLKVRSLMVARSRPSRSRCWLKNP